MKYVGKTKKTSVKESLAKKAELKKLSLNGDPLVLKKPRARKEVKKSYARPKAKKRGGHKETN